jgi:hypothetical protein
VPDDEQQHEEQKIAFSRELSRCERDNRTANGDANCVSRNQITSDRNCYFKIARDLRQQSGNDEFRRANAERGKKQRNNGDWHQRLPA